ncbi:MAG TPA: BTAD domain-containing putative transcriptional regulator [Candidatus Dormibacteraeota bacterium]|nr:BTAD domain-containing putative transcriptional regulator [Candidatus Dormibacteraeota bacterium]
MGDVCLVGDRQTLRGEQLSGRQGRLAVAYLVTERSRLVARDELADLLWQGSPPRAFDGALSAIVSKLRAALAGLGLPRDTLAAEGGCYQVRLPAGSWVDVEAALEGVHLAEGALLTGRPADAYGPAVVACSILRRPFLPGAEGQWVDARRRFLGEAQVRALDCLADVHHWNGEHALARRAAAEAVEIEPYRESGYRRLMRLHDEAGDRAEALRVYDRLTSVLASDLRISPGPETIGLRDAIALGAKNLKK